jgi:3-oxoacyl-[acyl-carrier protein] reductase
MDQHPDRIVFREFDLQNLAACHPFVSSITREFGSLYGLVNNAAIAHEGVLATMHETEIETSVAVNVTGTIVLTKYACRGMLLKKRGRIVNISSIIATTGFSGLSVYAATKAALIGFTKSLARELGKANICVNAIAPGYMATEMSAGLTGEQLAQISRRAALKRLTTVEEAAQTVEFLLSDGAGGITGTVLTVDCGSTA